MGKLFGTDGIRGPVNTWPMLPELAVRLGMAAGACFQDKKNRRSVVIGKDTRISGYVFESALTAGFCASGINVYQVGPLPTPAIAFITRNMRADFGVVISASHNPFHDNGIKFFDGNGYKLPDELEEKITALVLDPDWKCETPSPSGIGRAKRINDALGRYIVSIKNSFPPNLTLDGLRVVLDCANGASYKVAPMALDELGADVIKFGTEPDGLNINHQCGSLYPDSIAEHVREYRADVGIALDGDADRIILSDENGNILDGDQIMAICALDLLRNGKLPGKKIAATVMSNMALEVFMREQGGELIRTDVGDRYVAEAMRQHGICLGGEQSGHIIFMDYGTTGDGLLAGLQVLRIMRESGKKLSELAGLLSLYPQKLVSLPVQIKKPLADCPTVQLALGEADSKLAGHGRVLLRYSGTEALIRIMVECQDEEKLEPVLNLLREAIRKDLG